MDWSVLGIEATKDKKAITKAYRTKLMHTNPEDKPEEFKALRAAYEAALALADQAEEPAAEKTPLDLWLDDLTALYGDFHARIDVSCWRKLLSEEVCQALDTRPDAEEAMLRFFMEHFRLPHSVWVYLDAEFAFLDRKNQLYEKYPQEFVDYVIVNGIRNADAVPYELFTPGENAAACERVLRLLNEAESVSITECGAQLAELETLPEHHPYAQALAIQYRIAQGETGALEELRALRAEYPSDYYLGIRLAGESCDLEQWTEAEAAAKQCLELQPENYEAIWFLAQALAGQERYDEAVEQLGDMMRLCAGNDRHLDTLQQVRTGWNEKLIAKYRGMLEAQPDDVQTWFDLAWCYLQTDRNEEAAECAAHVPENQPSVYDYHHLHCVLCCEQKAYEAALAYNEKELAALEAMQAGTAEPDAKKLKRLPQTRLNRGLILALLGRQEEADEAFTAALALQPEDADLLAQTVRAKISVYDYEAALGYAERFAEVLPQEYLPHYYLALIHKMLNNDRAAYAEVNTAIDMEPSTFQLYELRLILLIRNGVYDQAHELLSFLQENGLGEVLSVRWCRAWLANEEEGDADAALEAYRALDAEIEETGEKFTWLPEFYYQLTNLTADDNDSKKINDRKALLELLNRGLQGNPEDTDCLDYKAWLLKREKRYDESREIYEKLLQRRHGGVHIERELASIYYADLEHNADKAAKMYERVIAKDEERDDHFYAGMSRFTMGDLETAAQHFLREEELDPKDEDGYYRLSYVYETMGRYEEALQQADRSIALVKSWKNKKGYASRFEHKAQILRRLGRPEEAVAVYRDAMDVFGKEFNGHKMIFYTYLQFGMRDKADEIHKEWKKFSPNVVDNPYDLPRLAALVELQLLRKQFARAKLSFVSYSAAMFKEDRERVEFLVDSIGGSAETYLQTRKAALDSCKPDHGDYPGYLSGYADALWLCGRQEEARQYAQQALEQLDVVLKRFYRNRTMHVTKKIPLLYMLGKTEEAQACYAEVQKLPMCEVCPYHACKDADIYTVRGLIYQNKKDEALELLAALQKKWPDETDFIFYENVLRKGKK